MTREQATALFDRVYKQLSSVTHPCEISLVYLQQGHMTGKRAWYLTIQSWGTLHTVGHEQDWQDYKREHAIQETDQDLEEYADAAWAEAERELAQDE